MEENHLLKMPKSDVFFHAYLPIDKNLRMPFSKINEDDGSGHEIFLSSN